MKQSEIKQKAIIEAATDVFISDGYSATTMQKIADISGVSKRTLYKHFPTKEDVFLKVLSQLAESVHSMAGRPFSTDIPIDSQLDYIVRGKIASMQDPRYRELARVTLPLGLTRAPLFQKVASDLIYKAGPLMLWLEQAREHDLLNTQDIDFIGNLIQGILEKKVFWPQLLQLHPELNKEETDQLVDTVVNIFTSQFLKN